MELGVRLLNGLLMIGLPILVAGWLTVRLGRRWRLLAAGGLTFIASQVLHIPFNQFVVLPWLQQVGWFGTGRGWPLVLGAVILGLSAGLFEESARWIAFRFGLKRHHAWEDGVTFGAGHGGIEAVLLGLAALIFLAQAVAFRHAGLEAVVPPEQLPAAQAQIDAFWAAPWYGALLGAVERVATFPLHIALSMIVLLGVVRRRVGYWLAAVVWHTLVNAVALIALPFLGVYAVEGLLLINAAIAGWLTLRLRRSFAGAGATA